MWLLGLLLLLFFLSFCVVLFFGPPYLPTLGPQVETALDLADLKAGETLLELGCGDGKVLVAAARRGWRAVGYELNPVLVLVCRVRTWRYRKLVSVHWGNFLTQPWPPAEAIFIFGLQRIMPKLDKKVMQSISRPVKLLSFAFTIPERDAVASKNGIHVYMYKPKKRTA